MKKNIIIAGPIGDFGGRDVEVNIIAKALEQDYVVTILSLNYMAIDSFALDGLKNTKWKSIWYELYKKNWLLKSLSLLSKFLNQGCKNAYAYLSNRFSKKWTNLHQLQWVEIENELEKTDLVILCVQLTTQFLPEIANYCNKNNIPCLVRTTGTIGKLSVNSYDFLRKVSLFIHHSETNALNLNQQIDLPYIVIDQCALAEKLLLNITSTKIKSYRYGYLGRLSAEKGVLPLATFFTQSQNSLIIAGDGPQKSDLLDIMDNHSIFEYLGQLQNKDIVRFFNKIDVLIIPSYEESGPLVGLEAMAAGKLIVSTKVGAMEERLKELPAFWIDVQRQETLEKVMQTINKLTEADYKAMTEAIRKKYVSSYSFNAIKNQYLNTIQQYIKQCE